MLTLVRDNMRAIASDPRYRHVFISPENVIAHGKAIVAAEKKKRAEAAAQKKQE